MSEENGATIEFPAEITELADKIVNLKVSEAVLLADCLEKVHGIKAAAGGAMVMAGPAAAADGGGDEEEAPTAFDVILEGLADTSAKIKVIKAVREITGAGLKEAKEVVEGAPKAVKEGAQTDEAETLKKKLEEAGAKITLKPAG